MGAKYTRIEILKYVLIIPLIGVLIYTSQANTLHNILVYIAFGYLLLIGGVDIFFLSKKRRVLLNDNCLEPKESGKRREQENMLDIANMLRQKEEELEALRAASEIFTSDFDIRTIIEYIYKVFNKFVKCDRILICFSNKDTNSLICQYELGDCILGDEGKVFFEDSIVTKCFERRTVIVITNEFISSRNAYGDKIAIPFNISNEKMGIIFLETIVSGTFITIDKGFLESLANYAAVAINNAELFGDLQLQKDAIETLYEETADVNEELSNYIKDLNDTKEELRVKNITLTQYYDDIQKGYLQTVMTLANVIEAKDAYTRGHCQRVMEISCEIATRIGMEEEQINDLRYAAILHDIGKIGVSADIINKEGKLTDEEFNEIKKHPSISYNILKDIEFIKNGLEGIRQHHERYDGRGYPNGIKGDEISVFGRILCIADAFDAMTSDRPYRKGMSLEDALNEVIRCTGTQFDPEIAGIFIQMTNEILY